MSDSPEDHISEAVARDRRFAAVAKMLNVQKELRDSETLKALMGAVRQDADKAMDDLADTSPADQAAIALLLVKVSTLVYIRRTLNVIFQHGRAAEQHIEAEDHAENQHEEGE